MSTMTKSLLGDYSQAVSQFQAASQGSYAGPSTPIGLLDTMVGSVDGIRPQDLVTHTVSAVGGRRPGRGGKGLKDFLLGTLSSIAGGALADHLWGVQEDFEEERRESDELTESAQQCSDAVQEVVDVADTAVAELISAVVPLLNILTMVASRHPLGALIVPIISRIGGSLIEQTNGTIAETCRDRDTAIEQCYAEFEKRCSAMCEKPLPETPPEVAYPQECETPEGNSCPVPPEKPSGVTGREPAPSNPGTGSAQAECPPTPTPQAPDSPQREPAPQPTPQPPTPQQPTPQQPTPQPQPQPAPEPEPGSPEKKPVPPTTPAQTPPESTVPPTEPCQTETPEPAPEPQPEPHPEPEPSPQPCPEEPEPCPEEPAQPECTVEDTCSGVLGVLGVGIAIVGAGLLVEAAANFLDNLPELCPEPAPEPPPEPAPEPAPEPEPEPEPHPGEPQQPVDGVIPPPPELTEVEEPTPPPEKVAHMQAAAAPSPAPAAQPAPEPVPAPGPSAPAPAPAPAPPAPAPAPEAGAESSSQGSSVRARKAGQW